MEPYARPATAVLLCQYDPAVVIDRGGTASENRLKMFAEMRWVMEACRMSLPIRNPVKRNCGVLRQKVPVCAATNSSAGCACRPVTRLLSANGSSQGRDQIVE
jgi:hypothetical protein